MKAPDFHTITGADWARALPPARERRESAPARIRQGIAASGLHVAEVISMPVAPQVEGLAIGTTASGQPTVGRIHPLDGKPESFGVFSSPALAEQFHRTFGGASGHVSRAGEGTA